MQQSFSSVTYSCATSRPEYVDPLFVSVAVTIAPPVLGSEATFNPLYEKVV